MPRSKFGVLVTLEKRLKSQRHRSSWHDTLVQLWQRSTLPTSQADLYRTVGLRAAAASVDTKIGCHSFRATGITEYLRNGGKLEAAQQMANHESARTTGLYDRRQDQVSLDEIERIRI